MAWETSALWRELAATRIEPKGATLSFAARLARENRWSRAHAEAVMAEYRRFLYLAATQPHAMTPSEDVDQAWHLHLAYSRHYWDELCGRILGKPQHHGPTAGGASEDARYAAQYEATLAAYRTTFGEAPPAEVWPVAVERFAARPVRIDSARYWMVPKAFGARAAAIGGAAVLAACATLTGDPQIVEFPDWFVPGFLILIAVLVLLPIVTGGKRTGGSSGGCSSTSSSHHHEASDSSSDSSSGCGGGGCGGGGD